LALLLAGCAAEGSQEAADGTAIGHVQRDLANLAVLDGATRIAFGGSGPITRIVFEPCRVAVDYADGSWTKGEWAALGHDGFTYTGTLYIEPEEIGELSGVALVGGGAGIELWAYQVRYDQRPAAEPNTVYRWSVGLDLVTVVTGDPQAQFGAFAALSRQEIAGYSPTEGDLSCLPPEMADQIRAWAAAGR
jgi:hypothetical protein